MDIGIVGLGRMGLGMGERLARRGHRVVGWNISDRKAEAEKAGVVWAESPRNLVELLPVPRIILIMVPAGEAVEEVIEGLTPLVSSGDLIIDGGNSFYKDSVRRAQQLSEHAIHFLDVGVSGGIWGLENGYCIMVGGEAEAYRRAKPIFTDLAPPDGCAHVGESGAGHYAKMIHNAMEYGILQAYGEGFELLKRSDFDFDLHQLAHLWNNGSVIRSWLLELAERAFDESPNLEGILGYVDDSGEGRWAVIESIEQATPAPVTALSLMMRFVSRQDDSFSAKVIAALRKQFGGHRVKKK